MIPATSKKKTSYHLQRGCELSSLWQAFPKEASMQIIPTLGRKHLDRLLDEGAINHAPSCQPDENGSMGRGGFSQA